MTNNEHIGRSTHGVLSAALDGETCPVTPACEGTLREGTYKGHSALVCDTCGTPATLVWR